MLSFVGMISGLFLPETLNVSLPETLAEAKEFGGNPKNFHVMSLIKESYVATKNNEE